MEGKTIVKFAAGILAAGLLCGGAAYAMNRPSALLSAKVSRGTVSGTVEESGRIRGVEEQVCYARVTSPLQEVYIQEGDEVRKGDLLLTYDDTDLERSAEEAEISRQQAEKDYAGRVGESDRYASKYAKAVQDDETYAVLYYLQRERGDSMTEEQYGKNYEIQCQIDGLNRQIAEKRREILDVTGDYNDVIDYGMKDPEDYTKKTRKKIRNTQEEINELEQQVQELTKALSSLPPAEMSPEESAELKDTENLLEDIARNWQEAKSDRAAYEGAILNEDEKAALRKNTELLKTREDAALEELLKARAGETASFNGIVTSCSVKSHASVTEGMPLFTLESSDDLKCTVMVSKYDIGKIKSGQRAEVDVAGVICPGIVTRVRRLATTDASDKNKVAVDVRLTGNGAGGLPETVIIGLEADVTIFAEESGNTLFIPASACYTDDGGDLCYVIENGRVAKRYFTAGIRSDDTVEVKKGLSEGDTVVTDAVTDGMIGKRAAALYE